MYTVNTYIVLVRTGAGRGEGAGVLEYARINIAVPTYLCLYLHVRLWPRPFLAKKLGHERSRRCDGLASRWLWRSFLETAQPYRVAAAFCRLPQP